MCEHSCAYVCEHMCVGDREGERNGGRESECVFWVRTGLYPEIWLFWKKCFRVDIACLDEMVVIIIIIIIMCCLSRIKT